MKMKKGDYVVQINAPDDVKFVRITGIYDIRKTGWDLWYEHEHIGETNSRNKNGGCSRKYLRKCTKQELFELKIRHGL